MKFILVMLFFLSIPKAFSLEIDEKLTLRFLKVSNSKKTILINRGSEDGLAVGDHAKFFITSGVIARGVVEKVSPSRSIWSLYRVIDPAEVIDGKVLNLKISSPVKITTDPSKSTKDEEVPAGSESMDMGAKAEESSVSADEQKELKEMGLEDTDVPSKKEKKSERKKEARPEHDEEIVTSQSYSSGTLKYWELFGTLHLESLSGKDDQDNKIETSSLDLTAGLERYFHNTEFFKNASLGLMVHKKTLSSGSDASDDYLEFGGLGHYYFYNDPALNNKLIGYLGFSAGAGNLVKKIPNQDDQKWSTSFYAFALGGKYHFSSGIGLKIVLDYYSTTEAFESNKITLSGPRFQVGVSYRF